jgi:DNA-binding NtrC family response regulator
MIALVEDDPLIRRWLVRVLEKAGHRVVAFSAGQELLRELPEELDVVCLDLGLEGLGGMEILRILREQASEVSVIVVTGETRPEVIVEAMRGGAYDYLVKPLEAEQVLQSVGRAAERQRLRREVKALRGGGASPSMLVGNSAVMQEIREQIGRLSESDVTVCLLGETGTGKEVVARSIHEASRRARRPFVAFNCAAVPEALEESELFGHEKGAFSGASGVRKGRFEQAQGGTLFLDEVGDMAPSTQAALLRTLQQRTITRLGGSAEIPVDVRILSATHRDLPAEVAAGRFRQDLYYRLVVYPIHLPPLRDRRSDLPLLVAYFLRKMADTAASPVLRVSPDALSAMERHRWSGNVRELENVLQRALLSCEGDEIGLRHLPPELRGERAGRKTPRELSSAPEKPALRRRVEEAEQDAIRQALAEASGNVGRAAELLGMSRATLYRRLALLDRSS